MDIDWWSGLHGLAEGEPGDGGLRLPGVEGDLHLVGDPGESVTLADEEGVSVYADLDADGEIDHITSVHISGRVEVWSADPLAAAWGLPPDEPVNNVSDGAEKWGLAGDTTPGIGYGEEVPGERKGAWYVVEWEETRT